ncbi:MAG: serine/threonine protein kinase with repeat [Myxococcales bacterium]|nr:serine/threonine protein kinase with repeat [Myxococcales bacterium]
MAEVQLAIQRGPAGFEKLVVVKLVHANLATQKAFVDMLLDEARMAAMLKHPNVVDIYDLGEAEGRYFIAMEYLEGEPLLAVLRAGREGKRLDPLSTARLISDTAEGLEAAHELRTMAGEAIELVHHDVSLGNIVVLYNGQVKLVDFGVAKATSAAGPRAKVQGKFSYMAPEKLKGDSGDRRSDIWSLGCVLWEALTLRRLFKGGNDADTMKQVLETAIAKPSAVNGDVHPDFDPIVMKALERDPANRYATAKQMAQDLEEVLREHKYGGKNDVIAKYMQTTFESHIVARKNLLQEVSSKGRASADVLEAAFDEPQLASGSPITHSGEFAVKFRQPTGEVMAAEDPSGAPRARSNTGMSQVLAALPRSARPSGQMLSQPYEPETSQVLAPLPRSGRPSGQMLSQPYEPETVLPGGGTTANAGLGRTKLLVIAGAGAFVLIAIAIVVMFGGAPKPKDPGGPAHGTTGGSDVIAVAPAPVVVAVGSGSAAGSNAVVATAAGSGSADAAGSAGSGSGSVEPEAGSADEDEIEMGSAVAKPGAPRPPKVSAQEMFKTGMQSYVKGDSRTAVSAFRRAVQAQPGYATAWRALGLAHEKLGEFGQAKTALQRYLQLAPNAADAAQIREKIGSL